MAKRIFILILGVIFLSTISHSLFPQVTSEPQTKALAPQDANEDQAMNATLLIMMYGFEPAGQVETDVLSHIAKPSRTEGLGTLVICDGQRHIVTHDHWSLLNPELELVQFRNDRQEMVAQVTGDEFQRLIQYRDGGTMILDTPATLQEGAAAVSLNTLPSFQKGSLVQIIYRRRDSQGGIAATAAMVETIEMTDGVPAFRLRSLNGQRIIPGDSGGGIWLDGQLVGNLWMTETLDFKATGMNEARREQNWSVAAVLTAKIQRKLEQPLPAVMGHEVLSETGAVARDAAVITNPGQGLPPANTVRGIG